MAAERPPMPKATSPPWLQHTGVRADEFARQARERNQSEPATSPDTETGEADAIRRRLVRAAGTGLSYEAVAAKATPAQLGHQTLSFTHARPASFVPQQYVFHVLGRPCMVLRKHKASLCLADIERPSPPPGHTVTCEVSAECNDTKCRRARVHHRAHFKAMLACLRQALVMIHELSNPAEYDDYLARALAPATPLMVLGRSRDAYPQLPGKHCLWYAWKDRIALSPLPENRTAPIPLECIQSSPMTRWLLGSEYVVASPHGSGACMLEARKRGRASKVKCSSENMYGRAGLLVHANEESRWARRRSEARRKAGTDSPSAMKTN